MSYGIAIIGSAEEVAGFAALGVQAFPVDTADEARTVLFQLKKNISDEKQTDQQYAVVFVLEELFQQITPEDYTKLSSGALPSIISLPGNKGSTGFGNDKIRRIVEKAVGSDIFSEE